jgi:hypothetical protein
MKKIPVKQVEDDSRSCMTEVSIAVDSWAANIKADKWGVKRFEWFLLFRQAVINE